MRPIHFDYYREYLKRFVIILILGVWLWIWFSFIPHYPVITEDRIVEELISFMGSPKEGKEWCPFLSPNLIGVNFSVLEIIDNIDQNYEFLANSLHIEVGGVWQPSECQARYESVIIVPYRNRSSHLRKFLAYMHPFLQRQQLHYRIIVVEQGDDKQFNRARLFNIGYKEALKLVGPNYCFIFHDVDLIPENDHNIYACTHYPRHMSAAINVFNYQLPYSGLFGGAVAILSQHFQKVNGFSNSFYGWGGEDDDLSNRLRRKGLVFVRFEPSVSRYVMLPHLKEEPSPERWRMLAESKMTDGLSSLTYEVLEIIKFPLHTHIIIE